MGFRIDEKDLKLLRLNMEIVHDLILKILCVSEVRFWIIPDQSPAEVLNEDSIQGALQRSPQSKKMFNSTLSYMKWRTEALPEDVEGANNQEEEEVGLIVCNFRAKFAKDDNELVLTKLVEHNINTSDNAPIKLRVYKTTPAKLAEIKKQVQQLLNLDLTVPSKSDWSAPVVPVGKNECTSRLCVEFPKLCAITKKDQKVKLPLVDQILDFLEGAQFYSSLNLAAGYWQVPLTKSARSKTAFSTPDGGHYEYKRLPMGLWNAFATFQRLMDQFF